MFCENFPRKKEHTASNDNNNNNNNVLIFDSCQSMINRSIFTSTYFDPRHVVLLHFLHFLFDTVVQFVFEFQRLHVIHVTVVVMEVPVNDNQHFSGIHLLSLGFNFTVLLLYSPGKRRP